MNRLLVAAALMTASTAASAQSLEDNKRARMAMDMFGCTNQETFRKGTDLVVQRDQMAAAIRGLGLSEFPCKGRLHQTGLKRPSKRMANCALAIAHSRGGIFHSFCVCLKTRNSSLRAISSVGK